MKNRKILDFLWVFPVVLCSSCVTKTKTNAEDYLDILSECRNNRDFHSQLSIFPENLNGEIKKFHYQETEDLFNGNYFFYLVLKYDFEVYNSEIERLKKTEIYFEKFNIKKNVLNFDYQNLFLSIFKDNRYEYAVYNSNQLEIAYISNQLYTWDAAKVLPEHSLPEVHIPDEVSDGDNSYNMYYHYVDNVGWEITD